MADLLTFSGAHRDGAKERNELVTRSASLIFETPAPPAHPKTGVQAPMASPVTRSASPENWKNGAPASPKTGVNPEPSPAWRSALAARARAVFDRRWQNPPFFIDWVTVSQEHAMGALPIVNAGAVFAYDEDGELDWHTTKAVKHEGSFETSVNIKCDGSRVTFSGNVSKFGRTDNVFGFDFLECLGRINDILANYGLPEFTAGERQQLTNKDGDAFYRWSGARFSRLDVTANYETGSPQLAHHYLQWLGSQHANRHEGRVLGQGETVAWGGGKGSRAYWKVYIKHLELAHRGQAESKIFEHCRDVGLVRFEGTLKTKLLTDVGAAFLGDWLEGNAMGEVIRIFEDRARILSRAEFTLDDLEHAKLSRSIRCTARDYLAGMDVQSTMSKPTFYRHRTALMPFGIDISVRNIRPLATRVQVINLKPASVPSWYSFATAA